MSSVSIDQKRSNEPVAALLTACILILSTPSFASTGSSWSQPPAWSSTDSSGSASPTHKSILKARDGMSSSGEVAPFTPGSNNLALDLGQVFLMGDLTKFSDSLGTQLHYTYGVSDLLAFDASFGYSQHSNGQFTMVTLLSGVRLNLSWYDKIIPYLVAGLGFYRPSYQDNTQSASASSGSASQSSGPSNVSPILFGLQVGPGVDLELSKNMFFGAAFTLHTMFNAQETYSNGTILNAGGSFVSFFLHVGTTF